MDDDVKAAFDELRAEIKDASRARTPSAQREGDRHVREARADLEDVLRENGYRISRRELDDILDQRDEAKRRADFERWYEERRAAESEGEEEEETDEDGKPKPKAKPKLKPKPGEKPEEEEWV